MEENRICIERIEDRRRAVQSLLRPIRPSTRGAPRDVAVDILSTRRHSNMVVARSEVGSGDSHRDALFRTKEQYLFAQYSEAWLFLPARNLWQLQQVGLHLYHTSSPNTPAEIFALHCEPAETGSTFQAKCKRGPHVHVVAAGHPLSHAHVPLNFAHLGAVLESMVSLTDALHHAVNIVSREIIEAPW